MDESDEDVLVVALNLGDAILEKRVAIALAESSAFRLAAAARRRTLCLSPHLTRVTQSRL